MGHVKQKSAFEHAQNVRNHIILHMCRVSSGHLLSIHTFYGIQWFCLRTAKAQISKRSVYLQLAVPTVNSKRKRKKKNVKLLFTVDFTLPLYTSSLLSSRQSFSDEATIHFICPHPNPPLPSKRKGYRIIFWRFRCVRGLPATIARARAHAHTHTHARAFVYVIWEIKWFVLCHSLEPRVSNLEPYEIF